MVVVVRNVALKCCVFYVEKIHGSHGVMYVIKDTSVRAVIKDVTNVTKTIVKCVMNVIVINGLDIRNMN